MLRQSYYMLSKAIVKKRQIVLRRKNSCIEWIIPRLKRDRQKVFIVKDLRTTPAYPNNLEVLPLKECYYYGTSTTN